MVTLLELQLCVGLGHLNSFVTVNVSRVRGEVMPLCPTPNLENQRLTSPGPYPLICLAWVTLPGAYAPSSKPPHDKVVVLKEDYGKYRSKIYIQAYFTLQAHNVWYSFFLLISTWDTKSLIIRQDNGQCVNFQGGKFESFVLEYFRVLQNKGLLVTREALISKEK
jgi:hypothetical protein